MRVAAAAAVLALAGCGGSAPASRPPPSPPPAAAAAPSSSGAPGSAFCARLSASSAPQEVYAAEVEHQVGLAGGGSVTPEVIQAARAVVALWITISCPEYGYLGRHG